MRQQVELDGPCKSPLRIASPCSFEDGGDAIEVTGWQSSKGFFETSAGLSMRSFAKSLNSWLKSVVSILSSSERSIDEVKRSSNSLPISGSAESEYDSKGSPRPEKPSQVMDCSGSNALLGLGVVGLRLEVVK